MFEWFIASRYLRSKRKEAFISVGVIFSILTAAVSVAALDVALSIVNGMTAELSSKFAAANRHITIRGHHLRIHDAHDVIDAVRSVPGISAAFPFTENQAIMLTDTGAHAVIVRGLANTGPARAKVDRMMESGETEALFTRRSPAPAAGADAPFAAPLIAGTGLRLFRGLSRGESVSLIPPPAAVPGRLLPRPSTFALAGFYNAKIAAVDGVLVYMGLEQAQNFFNLGDKVSGIEVEVHDWLNAPAAAKKLAVLLERGGSEYSVTDWSQENQPLWASMRLIRRTYSLVLLLFAIIASFSIVGTLVMLVIEKRVDIAVLKSMGASDAAIMRAFLLLASAIGLGGVLFGSAAAYMACLLLRRYGFPLNEQVFSLTTLPVLMSAADFFVVALAVLIVSILAGVYPSWKAARMQPAAVFRFA